MGRKTEEGNYRAAAAAQHKTEKDGRPEKPLSFSVSRRPAGLSGAAAVYFTLYFLLYAIFICIYII